MDDIDDLLDEQLMLNIDNVEEDLVFHHLLNVSSSLHQNVIDEAINIIAPVANRSNPRRPKRKFRHDEALHCIRRDCLGNDALFVGKNFKMMFRVSRSRVQRIMEDIGNERLPFFNEIVDATGSRGASMEARILLPLKTYAYGVAPHTFSDYFQMSRNLAKDCCKNFDDAMR